MINLLLPLEVDMQAVMFDPVVVVQVPSTARATSVLESALMGLT